MFHLFPFASTAIYNDAPQPWQLGFQDGASPKELHDSILFYLKFSVLEYYGYYHQ